MDVIQDKAISEKIQIKNIKRIEKVDGLGTYTYDIYFEGKLMRTLSSTMVNFDRVLKYLRSGIKSAIKKAIQQY